MTGTLFCLGFGYSARALARDWLARGGTVFGTYRRAETSAEMMALGVTPVPWGEWVESATHVLVSAAPDADGDPVLRAYSLPPSLAWIGYLSTTAVYGDHDGGWVSEDTPVTPLSERGRWRAKAEAEWLASGLPAQVFRLAGIYGPGRGPFEKVRNGTARRVIKPGQVFSRIHVEDIAQVLLASIRLGQSGSVWNVCDDDPAPPEAVLAHAAAMLGLPLPPEVALDSPELSAMARSFYQENKRVSNARIKERLQVKLKYPTYREGLAAILQEENAV